MREKYIGFNLWVVFFGCFCLCSSGNEGDKNRQTFVIRYKDGEQTIPVTVVLDYKKQTEYVINMNPRTPAKSVTLYDFKQRTIAYKDLTNRECFLGRLTHETLNEEINALQDVKSPVEVKPKIRSLDPKKPALTPTEIRNIAGQKTAVFCRKMNTWLLMSERDHVVKKREVEEYEERTHQYHGHRSTQYSHFERHTTRRRHRNKSLTNPRHRSQDNKSVAGDQNGRTEVPDITLSPNLQQINSPHSNSLSTSNPHLVSSHKSQNPPSNSFLNHYSSPQRNIGRSKETVYGESPPASSLQSTGHNSNSNNYGSLDSGSRYLPSKEYASYSNPFSEDSDYFNPNRTRDTTFIDYREPFEPSRNTSRYKKMEEIKENVPPSTTINTEEDSPFLRQNDTKYPNVHPSLIHLLPLYKPLGQEFDFSRTNSQSSSASFHPRNQNDPQRNIESELHPISSVNNEQEKFTHLTKEDDLSPNPDVSVNVLEVPKITNKFENINASIDQSQNISKFLNSGENYPSVQQTYFRNSQSFEKNHIHNFSAYAPIKQSIDRSNILEEVDVHENNFYVPKTNTSTTTPLPVLTTPQYFVTERTTPNSLYVPSVHTAFQNSEEFNSFQIFPDFIQANISSLERNFTTFPFQANKNNVVDEISGEITDNTFSQTEYSPANQRYGTSTDHRSNIPRRDNNLRPDSTNHGSGKTEHTYPSFVSNATNEVVPPYRRYQNALRDFRPDEIVIDVENIPSHTLPPATSSFHQRILTTIQPTVKSQSSNRTSNNRQRHNELESRIDRPTTRYPRRRMNHKTRRPFQNGSISYPHKVQNNHRGTQTRVQANHHIALNQYNPPYHTNRRQFHYPNQYNIPSQVRMPTEHNQLPQFSSINNLPPGVSMHPRHPQAPFADMVHSNRPPTIPIINNHQSPLKPHRQRHNRVKERHQNSCCRLRGTGAFQSCCRNGGPCCSKSQRRTQPQGSSCCSSQNTFGQVVPANQIQPLVRSRNQNSPPKKNEEQPKTDSGLKERCEKEKMCRTLYESTQQVMVCRNADVDGC